MQKSKSLLTKVITICLSVICCVALALFAVSCGSDDTSYKVKDGHLYVVVNGKETDLGEVKGEAGQNGAQGNGIAKVEINEEGKFVVTYTDGKVETIEVAHEHEWEPVYSNEATCVEPGYDVFVCNECNGAKYVKTDIGGHDYIVAGFYYYEDDEKPDDKAKREYHGTLKLDVYCDVCDDEQEDIDATYEVKYVPATHTEDGSETWILHFNVEGRDYEIEYLNEEYSKVGNHFYNGKQVDDEKIYDLDGLKEIFGEDYNSFTNKVIGCNDDGYAYFVCSECEANVLLEVRNPHKYGDPVVRAEKDGDDYIINLVFTCKVCNEEDSKIAVVANSKYVPSNCAAAAHVDWTYEPDADKGKFEKELYSGTEAILGAKKDLNAHRYKDEVLKVDDEYRVADLDEIFDAGDYEVSGNAINCTDTYGRAIFKCADCKLNIVLEKVLDNHKLTLEGKEITKDANDKDVVMLTFKCLVCKETFAPKAAIDVKSVLIYDDPDADIEDVYSFDAETGVITIDDTKVVTGKDCEHGVRKFVIYSYADGDTIKCEYQEDESARESADRNAHKLLGQSLSENRIYAYATLEELLGKTDGKLNGLEISGNAIECKDNGKVGNGIFTCEVCNKTIVIQMRANHKLEVDETDKVAYDPGADTYEGYGLTNADKTGVTGTLKLHCSVCLEEFEDVQYTVIKERIAPTCQDKGSYTVKYQYVFDGTHTKELHSEEISADTANHKFGDNSFDENEVYTLAQIKEIFGTNYDLAGNKVTCTSAETGKVIVKCDVCCTPEKGLLVLNVTGDHTYGEPVEKVFTLLDDNEEPFGELTEDNYEYAHVNGQLKFICSVCPDTQDGHECKFTYNGLEVKCDPATKQKAGKLYVEYTYKLNGVEYTDEYVLKNLDKLSGHIYTDVDGVEREFKDNKTYFLGAIKDWFKDGDLILFDNDKEHAAFVCEEEDCGLVLINIIDWN